MIAEEPPAIPTTTPDAEPTEATPVLLLVHVPPDGEDVIVIVDPAQTAEAPEIADGLASIVTVCVT